MTALAAPAAVDVRARRREIRSTTLRAVGRALGRSLFTAVVSFVIIVGVWFSVVTFFGVAPYITQNPAQVWNYLFTLPSASANRELIWGQLSVTLAHSAFGFVCGLVVAILVAIVFRVSRLVEAAFMPFALLLRSVPLLAIAPIIFMIFGIGSQASVGVIGGIVVLFPALVTIAFGLKNASPTMIDVVHTYGGSTWTVVRKVALPGSLPSLFAAARISVPGAITGALLTEWLSTGDGIGGSANKEIVTGQFPALWAAVVVVTLVALGIYMLVQLVESVVLARMGMATNTR
ncbi:ABC transporter permease subunit [Galbitalea sp. SE-J8]|uniref:ABC transporter permease n=1 Tax=Galbitalea sp. SE-J8 TaxID=3054952 RepID=UPI00259D0599|nr:ABC transporter permease subunit [Galbitalea sp. SE-J8]MDM4763411.1 ABC transporter permease subunit [Galbitalea sp. SE-J8]